MAELHSTTRSTDRPLLSSFMQFIRAETFSGFLLLGCVVVAMAWANSPWRHSYEQLWHTSLTLSAGKHQFSHSLHHWINEGLMMIFFLLVGLEIKREALVGELAGFRKAALPIAAAIGGMVVPAGAYALINHGSPGAAGWGIPMATDIAFALAVMSLLGKAVPASLKIFLTALAIVDDIGAVLVIALFYTSNLHWGSLGMGAVIVLVLITMNALQVRRPLAYAVGGLCLWLAMLSSGIHATLAGVLLAMCIPARSRIDPANFIEEGRRRLDAFDRADEPSETLLTNERQQVAVHALEQACERVQTPLQRMEHALHPWVSLGIMPLFALANAGVRIESDFGSGMLQPVTLGVIAGLVVGKPVGILLFSLLAVRLRLGDLPEGAGRRQLLGVGCLAGIGFTMSLFVGNLAFGESDLLVQAKIGVLVGSVVSALLGWVLLRRGRLTPAAESL